MVSLELQSAIDSLQIEDVYLHVSQATCVNDFDPKYFPDFNLLAVQQMQAVRGTSLVELDNAKQLLRVFVVLGTRWVEPLTETQADGEPKVCALIEAEFVAEYFLKEKLEQNCIDEFAQKNAIYHVWPYWRELLASQCERMRLPRLTLPSNQLAHHRRNAKESEG